MIHRDRQRGLLVTAAGLVLAILLTVAAASGLPLTPTVTGPARGDHAPGGIAQATDLAVTLEVPEVDCAGCNVGIRKALKGAGGVRRLDEGTPKNRIIVIFEPGTGRPDVYVEALRKAGFPKAHVVA